MGSRISLCGLIRCPCKLKRCEACRPFPQNLHQHKQGVCIQSLESPGPTSTYGPQRQNQ